MSEKKTATEQEFLFAVLREIADRVERCGASPELTHAISLVSDLRHAIGNQWNPADTYALQRVQAAMGGG